MRKKKQNNQREEKKKVVSKAVTQIFQRTTKPNLLKRRSPKNVRDSREQSVTNFTSTNKPKQITTSKEKLKTLRNPGEHQQITCLRNFFEL